MRRRAGFLVCLGALLWVPHASAQAPAATQELLRLVPADMTLCLAMHDLRGYSTQFVQSPWHRILNKSALALALSASNEFQLLEKFEHELSKRLDTRWPQLRDDILGDAVVFAFRHGKMPEDEHGLLLLKARDPILLARLIERINADQKNSGVLKDLKEVKYRGRTYLRRVERTTTHYYWVDGPLLAVSGREEALRQVLDLHAKEAKPAAVAEQIQRAGAAGALLAFWVNPRAFDDELKQKTRDLDPAEAHGLKQFLTIWEGLDALVFSFRPGRDLELTLTVQARATTPELERLFAQPNKSSDLWQRFPENALATLTTRVDAPALAESLIAMTPPPARKMIDDSLKKTLVAVTGLDLFKDVLPHIGPDVGMCLVAAANPQDLPQAMAAIAVRPGQKQVDQTLVRALHSLAVTTVLLYNASQADPLQLLAQQQDDVKVHYIAQDKLFPRGFQPAFALKDGHLVLASSPEAIKRFQKDAGFVPPDGEALCLRISFTEMAKLLTAQRGRLAAFLADKNQISPDAAGQMLDDILSFVSLFDRLTISQRTGQGQLAVTLRLSPAKSAD